MTNVGIVGYGEVGKALEEIYKDTSFEIQIKDKTRDLLFNNITVLNVCLPYDGDFFECVLSYIKANNPVLTIIHSTVLPGTTKKLQSQLQKNYVVHSPIRGNHPDLHTSLKQFIKYIGSDTQEGREHTLTHLNCLGITATCMKNSFSTELAKLLCTSYYGLCIAWHQLAKNLCDRHSLDYEEVMTHWNKTYNEGYKSVDMENVLRPVLTPPGNKIGGHCVIPNAELLSYIVESGLVDEILKFK
jgi:UDP-N-acetyl-D-mannosaminuronate dehydrogenase